MDAIACLLNGFSKHFAFLKVYIGTRFGWLACMVMGRFSGMSLLQVCFCRLAGQFGISSLLVFLLLL